MTPHDFHRMTDLRADGSIINLEGESGVQLDVDLLGRRYLSECVRYFDLETDYKPLSQAMPNDCAWIAKAFLLFLLKAFHLANGGQTVSL